MYINILIHAYINNIYMHTYNSYIHMHTCASIHVTKQVSRILPWKVSRMLP